MYELFFVIFIIIDVIFKMALKFGKVTILTKPVQKGTEVSKHAVSAQAVSTQAVSAQEVSTQEVSTQKVSTQKVSKQAMSAQKAPTRDLYIPINCRNLAFEQALYTIFNPKDFTLMSRFGNLNKVSERLERLKSFDEQFSMSNIFKMDKNGLLSPDILKLKLIRQLLNFLVENFIGFELECVNYTQTIESVNNQK